MHIITCLDQGGAEGVLTRLVLATRDRWDSRVVSLADQGHYGPTLAAAGIPVLCCEMNRRGFAPGLIRLHRFLRQEQPQIVQTWMYHADLLGGVAARLTGCRAVLWGIRNLRLPAGAVSRSVRLAARLSARLSRIVPAGILTCSAQSVAVHARIGYSASKFRVIPNGYDCARLRPDAEGRARLRAEWGIQPGEVLLGMVARWDPLKDHATLLDALGRLARQNENVRCVLVGAGMERANAPLLELMRRHELTGRIILAGARSDIAAVMGALDLHVLSSRSEAFPNVVAEAMACGTPCVATDVGDVRLIIGEHGWYAPPADPAALAAALAEAIALLSGPAREALQQACRQRIVEHFGQEAMVAAFERAWLDTMRAAA